MNKDRTKLIPNSLLSLLALGLFLTSTLSFALAFNIVPKEGTQLPTSFKNGQTVFAYYTVYNNTLSTRYGNFVKYLPYNVTQVTSNGTYPDTCGASFDLNGKGQAGSSCTLQLRISGAVNKDDPDPHHQLFVCFPEGKGCSGTQYQLNVSQDLTAYITTYNFSSIIKCPILSNGNFDSCSAAGATAISPSGLAFIPNVPQVWFTEEVNNNITACTVNNVGNLAACNDVLDISFPFGIAFHPSGKYVYITNVFSHIVTYCTLSNSNIPGSCQQTGSGFSYPASITINPSGTYAYIVDNFYGTFAGAITSCQISSNGSLTNCTANTNAFIKVPDSIAINPANPLIAYITSNESDSILSCSISPSNGTLISCSAIITGIHFPFFIVVNTTGTFAYITSTENNMVYYCALNPNGSFGNCNSTRYSFPSPAGIALY
ncbi:beta-propeller fold lactonase family protein [Legionella bononiensis]|uniref:Beta-propeller fold lactonase family protein n=1 Tax=Legionella bononiensis TaxID=2793102 RepID=A0ABS1WDL6_9GAMM|nr:beta-propeller fold lactonase family protein [Legionella bononiensis]MBL7481418.1 beta-propeller fold lactonase family protein [Legionella bononiensis]MBL7527450.1 beta-propeller fold lactonase family protein [Legionella bononiensis]